MKETVVISLGGSTIVQDKINTAFLKSFKKAILSSDKRFIIVVGGGKTCRIYQDAAKAVSPASTDDLDWIGIAATYLNAQLVRSVFGSMAYEKIVTDPTKKITAKNIIIAAGWKPGWSTDYDAVHLAKTYSAKTLINMTNVDYLYDKDPEKNDDAHKVVRTDWAYLQKLVGTEWQPGLNRPFDPVATALAAQLKLVLFIIGPDVHNLSDILQKKNFKGSIIQ